MRSTFRFALTLPVALTLPALAPAIDPDKEAGRPELRSPPGFFGPGPAWHHWKNPGPGNGWQYYGVAGGPFLTYPPTRVWPGFWPGPLWGPPGAFGSFWTNGLSLYGPPVPTYGPVPGSFGGSDAHRQFFRNPPPANAVWVGLGWGGYRSPSPRRTPVTVSVHPPAPMVAPSVQVVGTDAGGCLRMTVVVPDAAAEVWIERTETKLRGTERVFESPPLEAGKQYKYELVAKWTANGQERAESRTVTGTPGQSIRVDFTRPADVATK